jgi:hypothetical protein
VILLLREGRLPPAEIAHHLGAVGEGLPRPEAHHPGQRRGVVGRPVHRAGLLLHHPPARDLRALEAGRHGAVEVVVEGLEVGIALPGIAALVLGRVLEPVLEEAERVAVPGRDLHLPAEREMVEVERPAHVVVRDGRVGVARDRLDLRAR